MLDLTHHAAFELSLMLVLGYAAYPTAEAAHCSGILALFACAVLMGQYTVHSLSANGRAAVSVTLKSLAHLAETFVFMYMGLDLVAHGNAVDDLFDADDGARGVDEARSTRAFLAFAVVVVPLTRVLVVPPLCWVANLWRGRKRSLSRREIVFLVFAGLRGAIAFALARNAASAHRRTLVAATTAIVLFTTFVLGGLTRTMLRALGMIAPSVGSHAVANAAADDADEAHDEAGAGAAGGADDAVGAANVRRDDGGALARRWERIDRLYLQPYLGGPGVAAGGLGGHGGHGGSGGAGLALAGDGALEGMLAGVELEPLTPRASDTEDGGATVEQEDAR